LFMSAQHPGKVPQRFQPTVRRPPEPSPEYNGLVDSDQKGQ
jgi:hypothetical protein